MSLSRVSRQLRREFTANPKKAAILGLLFLVAVWFWAPLVWSWIDGDDPSAETPAAAQAESSASEPAAGPPGDPDTTLKQPELPKYPWYQIVQWMENDPRTSVTDPLLGRDDPFPVSQTQVATAEQEDLPDETAPQATPEDLGMVLSSTLIGPQRRVAQVNGKTYRQGQTVRLLRDGQQIEFTLAAVYPRRIVLNRQGEQFELTIPVPASSGRIELSGGGN